ncbi:hypothetical protein AB0368_03695 [Actinoplanes sp. NPDC051475]|uniref:hypothetical protein n=1 Tax=Actinoplanes sp. NPDC051475 TaxID=3157225 RepID=UPI0034503030
MSGERSGDRTERASDLMQLNAMALEETELSLHEDADGRGDPAAAERLHRLADSMTDTARDIADRARNLADPVPERERR